MSLPPIGDHEPEKGFKKTLKELQEKVDLRFLIAIGVALLILIVVLVYVLMPGGNNNSHEPTPSPESSTTTESASPTPTTPEQAPTAEPDSPLLKDGVNFPEVKDAKSDITMSVKGTQISVSQSGTPSLVLSDQSKVNAATDKCALKDTLTYCLIATTQFGSQSFDYFYTRDLVHSKLLRDSSNVRQVELDGSPSAAFMTIKFADQGERRVLAIAASDSSGYLIVLPEGAGTSTEDTLLSSITLK